MFCHDSYTHTVVHAIKKRFPLPIIHRLTFVAVFLIGVALHAIKSSNNHLNEVIPLSIYQPLHPRILSQIHCFSHSRFTHSNHFKTFLSSLSLYVFTHKHSVPHLFVYLFISQCGGICLRWEAVCFQETNTVKTGWVKMITFKITVPWEGEAFKPRPQILCYSHALFVEKNNLSVVIKSVLISRGDVDLKGENYNKKSSLVASLAFDFLLTFILNVASLRALPWHAHRDLWALQHVQLWPLQPGLFHLANRCLNTSLYHWLRYKLFLSVIWTSSIKYSCLCIVSFAKSLKANRLLLPRPWPKGPRRALCVKWRLGVLLLKHLHQPQTL